MNMLPPPAPAAALDQRMLQRVRALIYDAAGIVLNDNKASMVRARLTKRLSATGLPDLEAYLDFVEGDGRGDEMANLISAMTTNVTQFFRENHHFEVLGKDLAPRWRSAGGARSVWSAACSSGPEPYSIAMVLREAGLTRNEVRILATDIDRTILARAHAGRYPGRELDAVPPALRARYFHAEGDMFEVTAELRAMITFRALNLIGNWPFAGGFDAIFCRNVAIYFDTATQATLWRRLTAALRPGGRLFIGHSERLPEDMMNTGQITYLGQTCYEKSPTPARKTP